MSNQEAILKQVVTLLTSRGRNPGWLRELCALLQRERPHYNWVGLYFLDGNELVLGPYVGAPSPHTRIALDQGICGAAVRERQTVNVPDVNADPRYLACFLSTRSEIVVPISFEGRVVGEIDIDSDEPGAFGESDRVFLERVATLISPHCLVGWDTGGVPWSELS